MNTFNDSFTNTTQRALKNAQSRIQVLRILMNQQNQMSMDDFKSSIKLFKVEDVMDLIRIEETFYEYCKLVQREFEEAFTENQQIFEFAELCYNLKVLSYTQKTFFNIFRMFVRNFIKRVSSGAIKVDKIRDVNLLCKIYIVIRQQNHFKIHNLIAHTIRLLLEQELKNRSQNFSTDSLVEIIRFLAKDYDLRQQQKGNIELCLKVLSLRKKQLTNLQKIKVYFAYFEAVGFLGGKNPIARNITKQICMNVKEMPKKFHNISFEGIAFFFAEAPLWNFNNIHRLFLDMSQKWVISLQKQLDSDTYDDIRKNVYIMEAIILSGINIQTIRPANRSTIIRFLLKLVKLFVQQPKNGRLRTVVTEIFQMQFLNKREYLEKLSATIIQNIEVFPNGIEIIYQLTIRNIFDDKIAEYLQKLQRKPLTQNLKSIQKLQNVKLNIIFENYGHQMMEKNPKLVKESQNVKQQVKMLSKPYNFLSFVSGIQKKLQELPQFHKIFGHLFFKQLAVNMTQNCCESFIYYCVSVCQYRELAWLKNSIENYLNCALINKILKNQDYRKTTQKFKENIVQILVYTLENEFIDKSMDSGLFYPILSFLGDPFVQSSMKPLIASRYYELIRLLVDLFCFSQQSVIVADNIKSLEQIKVRNKLQSLIISLLKRDIINVKDNYEFILFLKFLVSNLEKQTNHFLIHQIILKGLQLNLISQNIINKLEEKNYKIKLYNQYNMMLKLTCCEPQDINIDLAEQIMEMFPHLIFKHPKIIQVLGFQQKKLNEKFGLLNIHKLNLGIIHFSLTKNDKYFRQSLKLLMKFVSKKLDSPQKSTKNYIIKCLYEIVTKNNIQTNNIPQLQLCLQKILSYHGSVSESRVTQLNISVHQQLIHLCKIFPKIANISYFQSLLSYATFKRFTCQIFLNLFGQICKSCLQINNNKQYIKYINNRLENANFQPYLTILLGNIEYFTNPLESLTIIASNVVIKEPLFNRYLNKKYPMLKNTLSNVNKQESKSEKAIIDHQQSAIVKKINQIYLKQKQQGKWLSIDIKEDNGLIIIKQNEEIKKVYGALNKRLGITQYTVMKKMINYVYKVDKENIYLVFAQKMEKYAYIDSLQAYIHKIQQKVREFEKIYDKV